MSPSEKDKMSGKETKIISQEDLDAVLKRTREKADDATFTSSIESGTGIITINRKSADGKSSSENIFPMKDGKFMI